MEKTCSSNGLPFASWHGSCSYVPSCDTSHSAHCRQDFTLFELCFLCLVFKAASTHAAVALLGSKGSVQAMQHRQIIIRYGTGVYVIHSLEQLVTLKRQAGLNARLLCVQGNWMAQSKHTSHFEWQFMTKELSVTAHVCKLHCYCNTYTLQVAFLSWSGNGADESFRVVLGKTQKKRSRSDSTGEK